MNYNSPGASADQQYSVGHDFQKTQLQQCCALCSASAIITLASGPPAVRKNPASGKLYYFGPLLQQVFTIGKTQRVSHSSASEASIL